MFNEIIEWTNTNGGRTALALIFLLSLWWWHMDLHSAQTIAWIEKSNTHNEPLYGDVFDLGLLVGAVSGAGLLWCIKKRS